jgi:glycosyltransferase involved in cell wall biosynthesis
MPSAPLPRISLVTPSYNQAAYLEATLESVLSQGYPNLQYGIVDGGSTDGSVDIIRRHRHRLDYAIIEHDSGQSEAINKGFRRADGAIVGWLNSDDTLQPGALHAIGTWFAEHPRSCWLIGGCDEIDEHGQSLRRLEATGEWSLAGALFRRRPFNIPQPATFWRRTLIEVVGLLDERLHHCMDFDLWCRFLAHGWKPTLIDTPLATYRLHPESKTVSQAGRFHRALIDIEQRHAGLLPWRQRIELYRLIGYQRRLMAVQDETLPLWREVLCHPWWLASADVRHALWFGRAA